MPDGGQTESGIATDQQKNEIAPNTTESITQELDLAIKEQLKEAGEGSRLNLAGFSKDGQVFIGIKSEAGFSFKIGKPAKLLDIKFDYDNGESYVSYRGYPGQVIKGHTEELDPETNAIIKTEQNLTISPPSGRRRYFSANGNIDFEEYIPPSVPEK